MAKAIFSVFFDVIKGIVDAFLIPVNALIVNVFPNFNNILNAFNTLIDRYIGNVVSWFSYLLPPNTRTLILFYLSALIVFYTITISAHAILKLIHIIKNIKIW